jgi:hypothetical protein
MERIAANEAAMSITSSASVKTRVIREIGVSGF